MSYRPPSGMTVATLIGSKFVTQARGQWAALSKGAIFNVAWPGLMGLLIASLLATGCSVTNSGLGSLEVQVWDHREAIGDFDELWLTLSGVGIHPTGRPRTEGWLELKPSVQKLDLTRYVAGREMVIARAMVEAGSYNAIRLIVERATGTSTAGQPVDVKVSFETAALDFRVRSGQTTLLGLDLMVLDISDHPGRGYELHLREVTANQ
jgi:hypothetical protein